MAGVRVAKNVAEESGQAGISDVQEFLTKFKSKYLKKINKHLTNLDEAYSNNLGNNNTIAGRAQELENNKNYNYIKEKLREIDRLRDQLTDTRKAGVTEKTNLAEGIDSKLATRIQELQNEIKEKRNDLMHSQQYKNYSQTRKEVYKIADDKKYVKTTLEIMSTVYDMRAEITGVEEKIGITFQEDGYFKLITIPMRDFLKKASSIDNFIQVGWQGMRDVLSQDPRQLSMNFADKTNIITKLRRIKNSDVQTLADSKTYTNLLAAKNIDDIKNILSEDTQLNLSIKRDGGIYKIVASGYIAEAITRLSLLGNYIAKQDSRVWYQGADIEGNDVSISLKNAEQGSPTLLRIQSAIRVLQQLQDQLSKINTTNSDSLRTEIASTILHDIFDLDDSVETWVTNWAQRQIAT